MERALWLGWLPLLLMLALPAIGRAGIHTQTVEYRHGDAVLEGYLAYDDAAQGPRPAVLVIHEWWGINDYIKRRTEQLAEMGYVAFAPDIYGKGQRATTPEDAGKLAGHYRNDRALLRARATAGLEVLTKHPEISPRVDPQRIAAIGYCFGGTAALELARSGAPLAGVVSFHGGLSTPTPQDARNIQAKVLVLHGAEDPAVPPEEVAGFIEEMRAGGVDWTLIQYGGAVHSFTNPDADKLNRPSARYHEAADRRSWEHMRVFFEEVLREERPGTP